jgi:hypothetical protein
MPPHAPALGIGAAGYLDWAKGVEWSHSSVPLSQCPEPSSPYVPYGTFGTLDRQGASTPVSASSTSNDSELTLVSSSNDASLGHAVAGGGCVLSRAGTANSSRLGETWGVASLLGLAGVVFGRRRRRASRTGALPVPRAHA